VFEFFKGALILLAGVGVLATMSRDLQSVVEELVLHLHLNPARRTPQIFIQLAGTISSMNLWMLAAGATAYAMIRFAEGYGLWRGRAWAEWVGAVSGLIYVPFELHALTHGVNALKLATLTANVAVVAVLVDALRRRRSL
jgi:uncharacterized membrane protein (DUF2068 family)